MKRLAAIIAVFMMLAIPASASHAPASLTVLNFTPKSVTIGWPAVSDVTGYGLFVNGTRVSTAGASATQAKFGVPSWKAYVLGVSALKTDGGMSTIKVEARWVTVSTSYPDEPTPPPPAPNVTLTSQPTNPTTETTASFTWVSNNTTSTSCQLDTAAQEACTSPKTYSSIAVGQHTFVVRVSGPGGASQTSSTWTIQDSPPPPPPTGSANIWVDSNGGTCARSPSPIAYTDSGACSSFANAYTAAATLGDVVGVRGNLGVQKFAGGYQSSQGAGSKQIIFKGVTTWDSSGVTSADNKVTQIHFGSPNLTFDGINVDADGIKTTGAVFENGGDRFLFKNGAIGDVVDEKGSLATGSGINFENTYFHDVLIRTDGVHNECLWAGVPEGMVIRNSRFFNCATMDIFFTYPDYWNPLPAPYGNVTLENNYFDVPRTMGGNPNGYSVYIAKNGPSLSNQTPMSGWRIRNNFFDPRSYGVTSDQPLGSNNIFCGNTGHAGIPSSWKVAC
jgi:hypothetical protein